MQYLWLILSAVLWKNSYSANILFITVLPSPSHHVWHEVLVKGLLENRHNITMLGYDEPTFKSGNYTVMQLDAETVLDDEAKENFIKNIGKSFLSEQLEMWQLTMNVAKKNLDTKAFKQLIKYPKNFFELIIFDMTLPYHLLPLIDHFGKIPAIGTSPYATAPYIGDTFGNHFCTYLPDATLPYTDEMTFFQRVLNTVIYAVAISIKYYHRSKLDKIVKEKFGENVKSIKEYENQVGLLLTNYDPILDFPVPVPPQIIPVGGLNARPSKKLPEDLQYILDSSKHGVILFSFGTNIDPSWWSLKTKMKFMDVFAKLNETVLWKYSGDDMVEVPKNVIIRKWYPQNDILGHKNVKLFITHNGALSTHEVMYHGVPVIGIPFYMEQINNAKKVEAKGIGKRVDFLTLTPDSLYKTIMEILENPLYKKNAENLSKQYKDRPESALQRAIFWIEYTLRHKDISNLSTKGRYMSICARENLDVLAFLVVSIISLIYFVYVFYIKMVSYGRYF